MAAEPGVTLPAMREPDKTGTVARAWRSRYQSEDPADAAGVCTWLVNGPFHPFWSWWIVGAVHLIDVPGIEPPKRRYPEAEHEIMIVSLNPEAGVPEPDAPGASPLMPPDLTYQFDGLPREKVEEIVELMIDNIVAGRMSPDSDYRASWEAALDKTVEHYRLDLH